MTQVVAKRSRQFWGLPLFDVSELSIYRQTQHDYRTMTIGPLVCAGCCLLGAASGAYSGLEYSPAWGIAGLVLGGLVGFVSFWVVTIPYVTLLIWSEKSGDNPSEPPLLLGWMFVPVMVASLGLSIISSCTLVNLIAGCP